MRLKRHKAFTLIELVVSMAIIAILIMLLITGISTARRTARDTERIKFLEQLNIAVLDFSLNQKTLPDIFIENDGTTLTLRRAGRTFVNVLPLNGTLKSKVGHVESLSSDASGTVYCYVRAFNGLYELSINMETSGWSKQAGTSSNPCTAGWPPNTL